MKVYIASYYWSGRYGAYQEYNYVIIAETKEVALGLALESNKESQWENWVIEEIDTENAGVHYVTSHSN